MSEELVTVEQRGRVAVVTLNRPQVHNAVNRDVTSAMCSALDRLEADEAIWALVVTGAGGSFCAGADLKAGPGGRAVVHELGGFAGLTSRELTKPIVAAVNGAALGGGLEICLACDLVVAEEQATFGLPEVRRGIVAAAGGLERLPRRISPVLAMELVLTGESISAARALEIGLINQIVPRGSALDVSVALAKKICDGAPLAVRYSKAVVKASIAVGEREVVRDLRSQRQALFSSEDAMEGARAFREKRSPEWRAH
ncbi:MAG: crotonase/enoyl-CoA hydratase family protein [Actinomycetota bacterium]|nr:crotonase/enoyl-CoA hydratase family protein [Actinomycetota bacterium]